MSEVTQNDFEVAFRRMCRRFAAAIMRCMADTDTSYADIASRLGISEKKVRSWMDSLMDGDGEVGLRHIADMCTALDAEVEFTVTPRKEQLEPA